jgi:alpha-glucuronidase
VAEAGHLSRHVALAPFGGLDFWRCSFRCAISRRGYLFDTSE